MIGTAGTNLDPRTAADHVIGYTIFNDWSARDLQAREMKVSLGPCKGKDSPRPPARGWSPPTSSPATTTPTASCGWA